jgi:hypothetical protein
MQPFPQRHSVRNVDVQRLRHKAIPTAMWFQTAIWFQTAMGLQKASPREAFACNRQN